MPTEYNARGGQSESAPALGLSPGSDLMAAPQRELVLKLTAAQPAAPRLAL